jgi:hypothetical protein
MRETPSRRVQSQRIRHLDGFENVLLLLAAKRCAEHRFADDRLQPVETAIWTGRGRHGGNSCFINRSQSNEDFSVGVRRRGFTT